MSSRKGVLKEVSFPLSIAYIVGFGTIPQQIYSSGIAIQQTVPNAVSGEGKIFCYTNIPADYAEGSNITVKVNSSAVAPGAPGPDIIGCRAWSPSKIDLTQVSPDLILTPEQSAIGNTTHYFTVNKNSLKADDFFSIEVAIAMDNSVGGVNSVLIVNNVSIIYTALE